MKNMLSLKTGKVLYDCVLLLFCYGYKEKEMIYFLGNLPLFLFSSTPAGEYCRNGCGEGVLAFSTQAQNSTKM